MATDLFEQFFFRIFMEETMPNRALPNDEAYEESPIDMFGVLKQGFARLSESLLGWGSKTSIKKSKSADHALDEDDENSGNNIEMAHFHHQQSQLKTKGHDFVLQHLSNPTWCDECGDFIWGLYKQCLRCRNCHFTCHQNCGALVRLGCKSKSSPDLAAAQSSEPPLLESTDTLQTVSSDGSSEPTNEKDETDSGYRSGTIPEDKLPRKPSQATLNREELRLKIEEYNLLVPGAEFSLKEEKGHSQAFQGFLKVTLNLSRPICMSLCSRPPSIYEALTKEHIVEQNTMTMSFYMPRDTMKSIHISSESTSKEVITLLLKKFHILDNPRKFALYEQELSSRGKIVKLRRVPDTECPLLTSLEWDPDKLSYIRLVLQENETGEVMWDAFSLPELQNFMRVLDREENEYCSQLEYKYKVMRKIIQTRLKELRKEKLAEKRKSLGLMS